LPALRDGRVGGIGILRAWAVAKVAKAIQAPATIDAVWAGEFMTVSRTRRRTGRSRDPPRARKRRFRQRCADGSLPIKEAT